MAQSTVQTLAVDEARRTENVANVGRVFPAYKAHIQAKVVEIRGFLTRYATTINFNKWKTQHLETLQRNLRDQFCRMEMAWDTKKGDVVDRNVFDKIEGRVTDGKEEVNDALLDSEEFLEERETKVSMKKRGRCGPICKSHRVWRDTPSSEDSK